ncbi:MAG: hypothetical protein ABIJ52_06775 [Pseudomonadota bacterium]
MDGDVLISCSNFLDTQASPRYTPTTEKAVKATDYQIKNFAISIYE